MNALANNLQFRNSLSCFKNEALIIFLYNNCASTKVQKTKDCPKHNYIQLKAELSKQKALQL